MADNYPDLFSLLNADAGAKAYYDHLPHYVKQHMTAHVSQNINTFDGLQSWAKNLTWIDNKALW